MSQLLRHRLNLAVQDFQFSSEYRMSALSFTRDCGDCSDGWSWLSRDDLDALYAEFRERGAIIHAPPAKKPWGMREFALRTPDGHRLTLGTEVHGA